MIIFFLPLTLKESKSINNLVAQIRIDVPG